MPFGEKKFFHMIQFDGISSLAINSCLFFSFRAFTQSFLFRSCDELFLSKQWKMFLHMVVSKMLKVYDKNDLRPQHAVASCVRASSLWLKLAICVVAVHF